MKNKAKMPLIIHIYIYIYLCLLLDYKQKKLKKKQFFDWVLFPFFLRKKKRSHESRNVCVLLWAKKAKTKTKSPKSAKSAKSAESAKVWREKEKEKEKSRHFFSPFLFLCCFVVFCLVELCFLVLFSVSSFLWGKKSSSVL